MSAESTRPRSSGRSRYVNACNPLLLRLLRRRPRLDLVHDGRVRERRRVAELPVLRNVAQEPPHDLAATSLRQLGREEDVRRLRNWADLLADVVPQLLEHVERALLAAAQRHVRDDRLARAL